MSFTKNSRVCDICGIAHPIGDTMAIIDWWCINGRIRNLSELVHVCGKCGKTKKRGKDVRLCKNGSSLRMYERVGGSL